MAHYEARNRRRRWGHDCLERDVLGAKKPLIILTFAAPNLYEKNAEAYNRLVMSIKKIG
jgi:hypothetical protein